jgi:glycosyltransferase involved in cell wall biosynthesis
MSDLQTRKPKVLFLYTELAGYVLACFKELAKYAEVHVVHWPVNKEAPFVLGNAPGITFYDRAQYDTARLLELCGCNQLSVFKPDVIICSGWVDKVYIKICRHYFGRVPTVLTLDNHWRGDWKQRILAVVSPFYLRRIFSHAWVPGEPQKLYAKKLYFPEEKIKRGFYSADVEYFSGLFKNLAPTKKDQFPRRFLYVGRYIESKGIFTLWRAFIRAVEQSQSDWELWCLGTGELYDQRLEHRQIKHFGFVQPGEMAHFIEQTGVFVLPSTFEPWGVVVHEMVVAGMPLICSDKIGAATQFLHPGKNGFQFMAGNEEALEELLLSIMKMDPSALIKMGEESHGLGLQNSPEIWANTVLEFLKQGDYDKEDAALEEGVQHELSKSL